jgi:hypothetical protein
MNLVLLAAAHWTDVMTAITAGAGFLLLFAGSIVALQQLGQADKARHLSVLTDMSHRWDDTAMVASRKLASQYEGDPKRLRNDMLLFSQRNADEYWTLARLPNFFEDLGILVDEGVIPIRLVDNSLGGPALYAWRIYSDYVEWEQRSDLETFLYFSRLAAKSTRTGAGMNYLPGRSMGAPRHHLYQPHLASVTAPNANRSLECPA